MKIALVFLVVVAFVAVAHAQPAPTEESAETPNFAEDFQKYYNWAWPKFQSVAEKAREALSKVDFKQVASNSLEKLQNVVSKAQEMLQNN